MSPTILAVDAWGAIRTLSTSQDFRYLDRTEGGASAEYRGSPVFQLYEGPESALYVVDLDKVGELRTYGPDEDLGGGEFLADAIFLRSTIFPRLALVTYLLSSPSWLSQTQMSRWTRRRRCDGSSNASTCERSKPSNTS